MIKPHGSDTLNPLYVADEAKRAELLKEAEGLPKLLVCSQAAANAVMMGSGYFNPLTGYMNLAGLAVGGREHEDHRRSVLAGADRQRRRGRLRDQGRQADRPARSERGRQPGAGDPGRRVDRRGDRRADADHGREDLRHHRHGAPGRQELPLGRQVLRRRADPGAQLLLLRRPSSRRRSAPRCRSAR